MGIESRIFDTVIPTTWTEIESTFRRRAEPVETEVPVLHTALSQERHRHQEDFIDNGTSREVLTVLRYLALDGKFCI